MLSAGAFGASGLARFAAHPVVNLAIAALFLLFALSFLGVIQLRIPTTVVSRSLAATFTGERTGSFMMGVLFTLTAFTCTAPFVGTLLVMSSQGNWRWPLIGMLAFSTAFAMPFFVLAITPTLLRYRPRAGGWLPTLEMILGGIEIGAAIKFVSNADLVLGWGVFTRRTVVALWILILLIIALAVYARTWRLSDRTLTRVRPNRFSRIALGAIVALVVLLVPALFDRRIGELDAFLPPLKHGNSVTRREALWMLNDYRSAIQAGAREHRPILVDFTGYTCTNCRWMEANMFPRPEVRRRLDQFVLVRLYTDGIGEPFLSQQRLEQTLFRSVALPLYAVLDPTGRPRSTFLGMTRDQKDFSEFLDRGAAMR